MAKKQNKKKRMTKAQKKLELRRKIIASSISVFVLSVLIICLGLIVTKTNLVGDKINATTASYITFKNAFDNNNIKIDSLKKMSDNKGMKSKSNVVEFSINGKSLVDYKILLLPINNTVSDEYISFYLTDENGNVLAYDKVSDLKADKLGKILYTSKLRKENKSEKFKLRVWIDKEYDKEIISSSFEVKIKTK